METGSALTSVVFSRLSLCSTSKGTALSQWNGLFFGCTLGRFKGTALSQTYNVTSAHFRAHPSVLPPKSGKCVDMWLKVVVCVNREYRGIP